MACTGIKWRGLRQQWTVITIPSLRTGPTRARWVCVGSCRFLPLCGAGFHRTGNILAATYYPAARWVGDRGWLCGWRRTIGGISPVAKRCGLFRGPGYFYAPLKRNAHDICGLCHKGAAARPKRRAGRPVMRNAHKENAARRLCPSHHSFSFKAIKGMAIALSAFGPEKRIFRPFSTPSILPIDCSQPPPRHSLLFLKSSTNGTHVAWATAR